MINFDLESKQQEIAKMLREDVEQAELFKSLVPSQLSFETFWLRYFFKLSEIELEEETRIKVLQSKHMILVIYCVRNSLNQN